jgi:predicted membrane channel-forming protein YqfA (hemolysin III family)
MQALLIVLIVETMPLGALISAARDRSLRHRPGFRTRFFAVAGVIVLPSAAALFRAVGDWTVIVLLASVVWGFFVFVMARPVLFELGGTDPGPSDDGGGGSDPADNPRPSPWPLGGAPLPDAEPSSIRRRDHHRPDRGSRLRPRRPVREPDRRPTRAPNPRRR